MRNVLAALLLLYSAQSAAGQALDGALLSDSNRTVREDAARTQVARIRAAVTDPDSLRIEEVLSDRAGKIVCVQFRAKNAFGGYVRNYMYSGAGPSFAGDYVPIPCRAAVISMLYAIPPGLVSH